MRYLAVDFGERRVGLAVCDAGERLVSPHGRIDRRDDAQVVDEILAVVRDEGIEAVVLGLPLNMDDSESGQSARVRAFAERLSERLAVPLHFQNEQLSTFGADDRLAEAELTRGRHRARQDAVAAAIILEEFLRHKED